MKTGLSLGELAAKIELQRASAVDLVATTGMLHMQSDASLLVPDSEEAGGVHTRASRDIQPIAHRQIGEHVGIPAKYYDRMKVEAPDLLAANVNHWFHDEPEKRMVRIMDGNVRAFLSDRYHRIDNWAVAEAVLPALAEFPGLVIRSTQITERKMYIKATLPALQREVKRGDVVEAGVSITNSEVGYGRYVVSPLIYKLVCLNGMIVNDAKLARTHLGSRIDTGDELYAMLTDEALEADDKALMLKTRDVVKASLSATFFDTFVERLRETTERKIEGDVTEAVKVLGERVGLTEGEGSSVLRHLIEGGDLSQYGLANAVTRTAQDIDSYDRYDDLEIAGGKIIDLSPAQWGEIALAA